MIFNHQIKRGVLDWGLDFTIKVKNQTKHFLTSQFKGFGTQMAANTCGHLAFCFLSLPFLLRTDTKMLVLLTGSLD